MASTYKNLYTLVIEELEKRVGYNRVKPYKTQLERNPISSPFSPNSDIITGDLITSVKQILEEISPPQIIEGLVVQATSPASNSISITSGKGCVGGNVYTLLTDTTIPIIFNGKAEVYYILLYLDRILVETKLEENDKNKLLIAKIIPRNKTLTNVYIYNSRSETTKDDAYIQSYRQVSLFQDVYGKLEEDSLDFVKNNIGDVLAETIVGTITLSENVKIANTQNTILMDSNSLKLFYNDTVLAKFNKDGTFFYNNLGQEVSRFTRDDARIGNILITPDSIETENFISGSSGFQLNSDGTFELNDLIARGTIYATSGEIGGFTITQNKLYGGTIQTDLNVGTGSSGVVMDQFGLRGYSDILGLVFNLPTDGTAPTFSSGIIREAVFEITTNSILRTSETVGDGTGSSEGILINSTGLYACSSNQTLSNANVKIEALTGNIRLKNAYLSGEIQATTGKIGSVSILSDRLSGGLIEGSILRGIIIESSSTPPRIRIDENGLYYQVTSTVGKYGTFKYNEAKYGSGLMAQLFNSNYPIFSILQEHDKADIRFYNRSDDSAIISQIGDFIVKDGIPKICNSIGSSNIGNYYSCIITDGSTGNDDSGEYLISKIDGETKNLLLANSNAKIKFTDEGGLAIKLTNKTGSATVKGYLVTSYNDTAINNAIELVGINNPDIIGVCYENGVADGSETWVVVSGIADVYFITDTVRGQMARMSRNDSGESGVIGQAMAENYPTSPFTSDKHFQEIGHVLESRTGAGLAKCVLHFN